LLPFLLGLLFNPEDGSDTLVRNIGGLLQTVDGVTPQKIAFFVEMVAGKFHESFDPSIVFQNNDTFNVRSARFRALESKVVGAKCTFSCIRAFKRR
jgi:hypothetical protein